jgi:sodium transport system ATP-binding protein
MIEAKNLAKRFGDIVAVGDLSLTVPDGHIMGLVGPNGAGKTTSLRMLYTVVRPDSGDALIDGKSIMRTPRAAAAQLGVLAHNAGIYPNLTARENILYFAALHRMKPAAARERASELVTLLDMQEWADRRARGFSHGQRLKTALARALVHRPRNIILDEPTNGLDVMAVRALRAVLRQLRTEGHCVLFSSHIMQEVNDLCDEVAVISAGALLACGTPAAICARTHTEHLEEAFVKLILSAPESP